MSVESALTAGRAAAEARMLSRCTIRRKTGTTTGPDGFSIGVWETTYTALPLRLAVEGGSGQSRRIETAGVQFEVEVLKGHLPFTTSDLRDGDLIEVISGENAGMVLRVIAATWQDQATARRVPLAATDRPDPATNPGW